MLRCTCGAFVPFKSCCPECGSLQSSRWKTVALSGMAVLTLAACYGAPYPEPQEPAESHCDDSTQDQDGDGWCGEHDSDEANPDVH